MANRQKKRNSAKKIKPTPKKKSQSEVNTYKRALFQSPDQLPAAAKESQTPNTQCIQRSKRNLFIETSSDKINENGKRERPVRRVSPRKRVNRSLSFQDNALLPTDKREVPVPVATVQAVKRVLSETHRQKMLWAVSNALREEGMKANHELFRPCISVLFKACQKLWLTKVASLPQEGSTSENMLTLAKQFTTYTINQLSQDPTAEHMAMVCGNIIKIAESQSESSEKSGLDENTTCTINPLSQEPTAEHLAAVCSVIIKIAESQSKSPEKSKFNEKTRDERQSMNSSLIGPDDSNEQPVSNLEKVCSLKKTVVVSRSTVSTFNKSSPTHLKQSSSGKKCKKKISPTKLNCLSNKLPDLKIVLTPLGKSKDCTVASNPQSRKVRSSSNSSESLIKEVCPKPEQLRRLTRSKSVECSEALSVTKQNANNSSENPEAQTLIVSGVEQIVCLEEGLSEREECNNKIISSNQINTPSKNIGKINTLNKNSPNAFSRVTRRKSQELINANVTSGNVDIALSEPLIENVKSPENISLTKNKIKDYDNSKPQTSYQSPRSLKKSSFNKRRKSKNSKENVTGVNESEPLSLTFLSIDYEETNHILTSCTSQESKSSVKVPENALDTTPSRATNVYTRNLELRSCISSPKNNQPLKSILCNPLVRTLRSNSKDSPVKSVTLNENDIVYYNVNSEILNEHKTDKSTKPKRRKSLTSVTTESSPQKSILLESKCEEVVKSPLFVDCKEMENSFSQECTDSNLDGSQDCEKDKENIENRVVANSCYSERKLEADNTCSSPVKRLPTLTPTSQMLSGETVNRTLQLYNLSNNGDIQPLVVFGERLPPVLIPHWEQQTQSKSRSTDSPPPLLSPHWEQMHCSGGSTSLPESIMSHWQQMASNVTSDKITFDFEDTSYEIQFSPNNENSTASSLCAPFEFPHLIDESKSGFNLIYGKNSTDSCGW